MAVAANARGSRRRCGAARRQRWCSVPLELWVDERKRKGERKAWDGGEVYQYQRHSRQVDPSSCATSPEG